MQDLLGPLVMLSLPVLQMDGLLAIKNTTQGECPAFDGFGNKSHPKAHSDERLCIF